MPISNEDLGKIAILLVGALAGRLQKTWEVASSDLRERVDELCKLADRIADDAGAYWSRDRLPDDAVLERRLLTDIDWLDLLRIHCADDGDAFSDRTRVLAKHDAFWEAVSSGSFQSVNRVRDPVRAERVRRAAMELILALREARRIERRRIVPRWVTKLWRHFFRH